MIYDNSYNIRRRRLSRPPPSGCPGPLELPQDKREQFTRNFFGKVQSVWKVVNRAAPPRAEPFPTGPKAQTKELLAKLAADQRRFEAQLADPIHSACGSEA